MPKVLHEDGKYYETDVEPISDPPEPLTKEEEEEARKYLESFGVSLEFRGSKDYIEQSDRLLRCVDALDMDKDEKERIMRITTSLLQNAYAPRMWADMGYDNYKQFIAHQAKKLGVSPDDPEFLDEMHRKGFTPRNFERDIARRMYEYLYVNPGKKPRDVDFRIYLSRS
jgi:hypothetical protein